MNHELEVYLGDAFAGHLVETRERWSFLYADVGAGPGGHLPGPVSLALPRQSGPLHGDTVRAVFANLLPEGELRHRLALSLGLSAANDFALLARVGGDCPGAVRLRTPGGVRDVALRRTLDAQELRNAMAVLPVHPLLAEADGLRVTLPGEFDKLPVCYEDGRISLVLGEAPTSHILKPAKPGLRESVMNEAFVMALGAAAGLPVAPCTVVQGQVDVLVSTRVDRQPGEPPRTVGMEDLCQVAGLPPSAKYEREGGLRLVDIAALLRRVSTAPALDLRALLRWVLFSFLVGFGAGHAKQLALLHGPRGPRLAPFFGLWSTHVYPEMNYRLGYAIGGEDRPDWITAARWIDLARGLGVRPRYLLEQLREMATLLPRLAASEGEGLQRQYGFANVVQQVRVLVEQRSRQALVSLEAELSRPEPAGES